MSILDTTIVSVAIPTLARDFQASLPTIQWVSTAYLIALVSVVPFAGWAASRLGNKRLYSLSIAFFITGCALSGFAWSAGSLIAFRVLAGWGGGMIVAVGAIILSPARVPNRVGRTMTTVGVAAMLAPLLGPLLGGWIVEDLSWRWIFFLSVSVGALALTLALLILPADRPRTSEPLAAPREPGLRADLRLLRSRAVVAASGIALLLGAEFFGTLLLLPLYFQVVRGESPVLAGLLLVPRGVGAAIAVPIGGRLTDRFGAGRVVLAGVAITVAAMVPWTQVGAATSHWLLGGAQFVQGLGIGLSIMSAVAGADQAVARAVLPRATPVLGSIQRVGGSIGTVLLAVVLQHQIGAATAAAGGVGLSAIEHAPAVAQARLAPRLAAAFGHTFWWALGLTALAALPALLLSRAGSEPGGQMAAGESDDVEVGLALPPGSGAPAPGLGCAGMVQSACASESEGEKEFSDPQASAAARRCRDEPENRCGRQERQAIRQEAGATRDRADLLRRIELLGGRDR